MKTKIHHSTGKIEDYTKGFVIDHVSRVLHACLVPLGAVEDLAKNIEARVADSLIDMSIISESALFRIIIDVVKQHNSDAALLLGLEQKLG